MLEIVQKGQDNHQGVGYLPDGTMVVVEQAFGQIGQTVEIEFIRSLQTAASKMMFARRVESNEKPQTSKVKPSGKKPVHESRQQNPTPRRKKRPDHEATLIDLVDKQS